MTTTVYTDGACINNPGPGGWAWAVPDGAFASGSDPDTTNQRMELTAVLEAVRSLGGPLRIISDSKYVVNCFEQRWHERWQAKGWKNANRQSVANQDLWKPLIEAYRERELVFEWIKGHGDDAMNDVVDRLAVEAARTQTGRGDSTPPATLGESDVPSSNTTSGTPNRLSDLPGWRVVVLGHRPPELGGYELDNPIARRVTDRLTEIFAALREVHSELVVVTGLDLGAEQLGADAALHAGVPYAVVHAFPGAESVWPGDTQARYRRLVDGAIASITMSKSTPKSKQEAGMAIGRRNDALAAAAHGAVAVWDGTDRRIGQRVTALERKIDDVWIVAPA